MSNFLQPPPQGAIPTKTENIPFKTLQWRSFRTPESYAKFSIAMSPQGVVFDEEFFAKNKEKVGFSYWDKETERVIQLEKFRFFVMDTVCRVEGKDEDTNINYRSSTVFDTRTDVMAVYAKGIEKPVYKGIYKDFKDQLKKDIKKGVGFHTFFAAWSPELGFIEVPTSAFAGEGARMAIAATQGRIKHADINLFDLAKKEFVWGFVYDSVTALNSLIPMDKEGNPYAMKGELFFAPKYSGCGNMIAEHPLYKEFIGNQTMFREYLNAKIKRSNDYYNNYKDQETPPQAAAPSTQPPAQPSTAPPPPPTNDWRNMFGGSQQPPAQPSTNENGFTPPDDLPF